MAVKPLRPGGGGTSTRTVYTGQSPKHPVGSLRSGGTGITGLGPRAENEQHPHSPVLEEEDLPTDLRDAIEDYILYADLGGDGSQRGGGAGAGVDVTIRGWP